jgi:hypothetical protein
VRNRPSAVADPRCAALERSLRRLEPRRELAHRYALRRLSEHCRGDVGWDARVAELERALRPDDEARAALMRDAAAIARRLLDPPA